MNKTIAYIVTEGPACFLCVLDQSGRSHRFPMDLAGLARVQAEIGQVLCTALQRMKISDDGQLVLL